MLLPKDQFIFPDNPQDILKKKSTVELGNEILSSKPAILKSERLAKEEDLAITHPIDH